MWATMDLETSTDVAVQATTDHTTAGKPRVRIQYGADLVIRINVAEAVDLATGIAEALAEIDRRQARELHRDEDQVRTDAEIREAL